ncbi:PREDICTED: uncharacterized protein LOC109356328 [Lupinus angustifolius]|uniref:uncharacterized protein LOC109356328 n=1 Tax=Lupinus angustifolius TaxID=3871 RepID=UPI00092FAD51|nr:PREDICTED: uncharacterized protein LOC109356328 [Lupinus angustifolius]
MGTSGTNFPANLPILDGKNWNRWKVQMKVIMGYQEVDEIVEQGYSILDEGASDEQRRIHKENKKKDCKAMFLLHQCVDEAHFEKISGATNSKEAWWILEAYNQGAEQLRKVRLQTLRRKYELMQMEGNEKVDQFFHKVVTHMNVMKACGEKITDQPVVEKILRTLTPNFDHIVVAIEESKNLKVLKIEDLQGSLEAHEQRLIERSNERSVDQALQAQVTGRKSNGGGNGFRGKGRGSFRGASHKNFQNREQERFDHDKPENSVRRGGLNHWRGGRKTVDKRKIRYFNCGKLGHFSTECKSSSTQDDNKCKQQSEAHMAKEEIEAENDDQPLLLMMVTSQVSKNYDIWYVDSSCSSHMTRHRDWLVNFDETKKSIVRFAKNRVIQAEGTGDVLINKKDGNQAMITDVLYVPNMKNNLISMGQLLEKGFSMELLNGALEIYDQKRRLVMRATMASNRTFQISLVNVESQCLSAMIVSGVRLPPQLCLSSTDVTIAVKSIYKLKLKPDGTIAKHKARLVAKGFMQKEGIDYSEVFAPIARLEIVRLIVALASWKKWKLWQLDVKSAFLNGPLEEVVFVNQPPGFINKGNEGKVLRLKKALYGLKQAPRAWNKRIDKFLSDSGF